MVQIDVQETPNPDARRFLVDIPVQDSARGRMFRTGDTTTDEPFAERLLSVFGVESVMLLPNSVTVNKTPAAAWENLEPTLRGTIEAWFDR